MSKRVVIILILSAIGLLCLAIFPQMVSYGVGRALQYVHIAFSFILLFVIYSIQSKLETEKREHKLLTMVNDKRKSEIYKLRQSLNDSSRTLGTILAQEGQAYLSFTKDGKVSLTYSRSCLNLLECEPGNMHIGDVLRIPHREREDFDNWINILFEQLIDFEEAVPLGPTEFIGTKGRSISISYEPIKNDVGELLSVLVVAQDVTDFEQISRQAVEKAEESEVIARLIKQKESFMYFNQEFNDGIKKFSNLVVKEEVTNQHVKEYLRFLHGVKGGFFQIGLSSFGMQIHDREDVWGEIMNKPERYRDQLKNDLSFLRDGWFKFISKYSKIVGYSLEDAERTVEFTLSEAFDLYAKLSIMVIPEKINKSFKEKLSKSIGKYFEQYQDLVQEIAGSLNKNLYPMKIVGGEVKVIPEAYKDLFVSMGHLFRNSIDHGIETPERRQELHKDPYGKIELRFSKVEIDKKKSDLLIEVIDDGKGINPEKLRESLVKKGNTEAESLKDDEVIQKIFEDGISTKSDKKNLLSGRGVGVSAVKEAVEKMGGTIIVSSEINQGCHFKIQVPFIELNMQNLPRLQSLA